MGVFDMQKVNFIAKIGTKTMECLECQEDLSQFADYEYLSNDNIICPNCGHKMILEYEEHYSEENGEDCLFYLCNLD